MLSIILTALAAVVTGYASFRLLVIAHDDRDEQGALLLSSSALWGVLWVIVMTRLIEQIVEKL